jgi:hypothetical protein
VRLLKNIQGFLQPADAETVEKMRSLKVGQVVEIALQKFGVKPRRSTLQNAYYWAVVVPYFVQITGDSYDKDDFHYWLKCEVFGVKKMEKREVPAQRTRDLTTDEMEAYLSKCRAIGWDRFGIMIPKPNEAGYEYV